jgi:hypothetical protein
VDGVDEVVGLLKELRDSRGLLGRAAVLARGAAAMRELSPGQRRELAIAVAERAAPQLVPRIESETGLDLSPAQVSAVMDLALRLDRDQLDDLVATLESPETRRTVGREVLEAAGRELDEELDLGLLPPPGAAPDVPTAADEPREPEDDAPVADDLEEDDDIAELRAELERTRREVAELEAMEGQLAEGIESIEALVPDDGPGAEPPAAVDEPATTEEPPEGPAIAVVDAPTAEDPAPEAAAGATPAATADEAADEPDDEPDGPDRRAAEDAVRAVRRARSAGAALGRLTRTADLLAALSAEGRREALRAVPDGWARRRGAERLVEAGMITDEEAPALLRCLDRPSDRTWVAGTLIAHRVTTADALAGLVPPDALDRLARRP